MGVKEVIQTIAFNSISSAEIILSTVQRLLRSADRAYMESIDLLHELGKQS
jgi:hypothetical protein